MLTTDQLKDIENLQKEVEVHDGLQLKLNWEMLTNRESDELDFLHYENDDLIAFIGIYAFGSTAEVTGMVKPGARRKGHFTRLFNNAMARVKRYGYKKVLLNAPSSSEGAKIFLKNQAATYGFTEHQMQWQPQSLEVSEGFSLRHATIDDLDMRVRLDVECFGVSQEDALSTESRIDGDVDTDMLMIEVKGETIGKIRVKREFGQSWIYGFSIFPEHQGRGVGSKVLRYVVKQQSKAGHSVHLEVETKNAHALNLYETVGFKVFHAQDYYIYNG